MYTVHENVVTTFCSSVWPVVGCVSSGLRVQAGHIRTSSNWPGYFGISHGSQQLITRTVMYVHVVEQICHSLDFHFGNDVSVGRISVHVTALLLFLTKDSECSKGSATSREFVRDNPATTVWPCMVHTHEDGSQHVVLVEPGHM